MEKGKGKENGEGERKRKEKGKGRWKEDSLINVGRTDGRTHGHSGDFILCPMLCIALDRQKAYFTFNQLQVYQKYTASIIHSLTLP